MNREAGDMVKEIEFIVSNMTKVSVEDMTDLKSELDEVSDKSAKVLIQLAAVAEKVLNAQTKINALVGQSLEAAEAALSIERGSAQMEADLIKHVTDQSSLGTILLHLFDKKHLAQRVVADPELREAVLSLIEGEGT